MKDVKIIRKAIENSWTRYRYINPNTYCVDPGKAYLFNFDGNKCYNYEIAVKFSQFIERLAGLKEDCAEDVEVLTVEYDDTCEKGGAHLTDRQRRQIAGNILMQFVVDENGVKLSMEDAIKNVSKLTFLSYCRGTTEVDETLKWFKKLMVDESVGFSGSEANLIVDNIMHIAYAPETENDQSASVRFHSFSDRMFGEKYEYWYGDKLNGVKIVHHEKIDRCDDELDLHGDCFSNSILIFASRLLNDSRRDCNDHSIRIVEKDDKWKTLGARISNLGVSYRLTAPCANVVSNMFGYAIARSVGVGVNNAKSDNFIPRPSLMDIAKELVDIKGVYSDATLKDCGRVDDGFSIADVELF